MLSSQKRDGVFTFNNHLNPLLSSIVDSNWRKDTFKDIHIYIPENAKSLVVTDTVDTNEILHKPYFNLEKSKEWLDIGLHELLGKFIDSKDLDKKDK